MKSFYKMLTAFFFVSALFASTSCGKDDPQEKDPPNEIPSPVLEVKNTTPVESSGGELKIEYKITNPVDGAALTAKLISEAKWISEITVSEKIVSAKVAANYSVEPRTAEIELSYAYAKPVIVAVVQNPLEPAFAIDIKLADLKDVSAVIEYIPTDESALYYVTVLDSKGYEVASADWAEYVYTYYANLIVGSLDMETVVRTMGNQGKQTLQAKGLTPDTEYYACAVGVDLEARLTTDVKVLSFTTLEEYKMDYGFNIKVSDVTSRGATVSIEPKDKSANYYWNVMPEAEYEKYKDDTESLSKWFQKKMAEDRLREWGEYADMLGSLSEYIYGQCTHSGSPDEYTYKALEAASAYRVYAFWVDEMTGTMIADATWSEPFITKEKAVSSVTIEISPVVTDGDNWKEIAPHQRYDYLAGKAVLGFRVKPGENVSEWYVNIYDETTVEKSSEEELISSVMLKGTKSLSEYYVVAKGVDWGGSYFVLGVAVDTDGNNTKLIKVPFKADKSAVETLTELPKGY